MNALYFISWYDRHTNRLVGEVQADFIRCTDLQQVFNLPFDEPVLVIVQEIVTVFSNPLLREGFIAEEHRPRPELPLRARPRLQTAQAAWNTSLSRPGTAV